MGKRSTYNWGRFKAMEALEVGECKVVGTGDERVYGLFRTRASSLKRDFGVRFALHYDKKTQEVWATRKR